MAKSKTRRKIKIKWKQLLAGILAFLAIAGSVVGIAALATKNTKKVSALSFSRGSIDGEGNYEKSTTSIYTEDFIECQGLTIEPDFKASGTYQVFYYDSNKSFLGVTEKINADDGMYEKGDSFVLAKYARIVITPDASANTEDGEDFKIRFWEAAKYAREYTITIDKKQVFKNNNLCIVDVSMNGKHWNVDNNDVTKLVSSVDGRYTSSKFIDVSECEELKIYIPSDANSFTHLLLFISDSKTTVLKYQHLNETLSPVLENGYYVYTVSVPEDANFAVIPLVLEHANRYVIITAQD